MVMFAILFGLSMDYEVFLLSRVREEYLKTGDNEKSVIHGIASTARVITSAALIMIVVFLSFVIGDDPSIKMVRPRSGHCDLRGRHDRAIGTGTGDHEADGQSQLVDPRLARSVAADHSH